MVVGNYIIGDLFVYVFIKDEVFVDEFFWQFFLIVLMGVFNDVVIDYVYFLEVLVQVICVCFFVVDVISVVYDDWFVFLVFQYVFYQWEGFVEGFYIWLDCVFKVIDFVFVMVVYIDYYCVWIVYQCIDFFGVQVVVVFGYIKVVIIQFIGYDFVVYFDFKFVEGFVVIVYGNVQVYFVQLGNVVYICFEGFKFGFWYRNLFVDVFFCYVDVAKDVQVVLVYEEFVVELFWVFQVVVLVKRQGDVCFVIFQYMMFQFVVVDVVV